MDDLRDDLVRVLKRGGHFLLEWDKRGLDKIWSHLPKEFIFRQSIVLYRNFSLQPSAVGYSNHRILLWFNNGEKAMPRKRGYDAIECNGFDIYENGRYGVHDKPVKAYQTLVWRFSDEGDLVLDPFLGSGSVGIAAVQKRRNFVGFEINEDTYNYTVGRFKQEAKPAAKLMEVFA